MSKKLFVGNLPYTVNDQALGDAFASYSPASANVVNDKFTGRSRGFGFVEIEDDAAATKAIEEMNGKEVEGRALVVNEARPREERPRN
ncbi:MAG TPA: RNA-binding protein [Candidatus Saccharimonadales bacterium]|nr:RNA-binding protein [Candidatus Saccharimonadales bacterium]